MQIGLKEGPFVNLDSVGDFKHGGIVRLIDIPLSLEVLLKEGDTAASWSVVTRLIAAMEHNQVRSLMRPIEVGTPGCRDSWVIG